MKIFKHLKCCLTAVLCIPMFTVTAHADSIFGTVLNEALNPFNNFYKLVVAISLAMAAVCISALAFNFFLGNEKKMDEAKIKIIKVCLAVAAILLLPAIVNYAKGLFSATGWKPDPSHNTWADNVVPPSTRPPSAT